MGLIRAGSKGLSAAVGAGLQAQTALGGRGLLRGTGAVRQPIVLTSPTGTVFRTADGRVLVRGTRTVTQEQSNG